VLSGRLLGLANSAYYGAGRINNLRDAVQRVLGVDVVRNMVLVLMCSERLQTGASKLFNREQHWSSAFAVAQLARALAAKIRTPEPLATDVVQLLGLLHNIGSLLLAFTRPKEIDLLLAQADTISDESEWPALEARVFGVDRYVAAAVLLTHWHLPQDLCQRLRSLSSADLGENDAMVALLHAVIGYVGDYFAGALPATRLAQGEATELTPRDRLFMVEMQSLFALPEDEVNTIIQRWRSELRVMISTAKLFA